jgi:small-conductance mechanosensitive channel
MPLFRRRSEPDSQVAELTGQLAALRARLDAIEEAATRLPPPRPMAAPPATAPRAPTSPGTTPPLPPPSVDALTAPLRQALDELSARFDAAEQERVADRDRVDTRLTELSTTLTDQLHELSGGLQTQEERLAAFRAELEALAAEPPGDGATDLDELRAGQARIANEVARHEIAFHQELAALADRLGRQRPTR